MPPPRPACPAVSVHSGPRPPRRSSPCRGPRWPRPRHRYSSSTVIRVRSGPSTLYAYARARTSVRRATPAAARWSAATWPRSGRPLRPSARTTAGGDDAVRVIGGERASTRNSTIHLYLEREPERLADRGRLPEGTLPLSDGPPGLSPTTSRVSPTIMSSPSSITPPGGDRSTRAVAPAVLDEQHVPVLLDDGARNSPGPHPLSLPEQCGAPGGLRRDPATWRWWSTG